MADDGADLAFSASILYPALSLAGGPKSFLCTAIRLTPDFGKYRLSGSGTTYRRSGAGDMGLQGVRCGFSNSMVDISLISGSRRRGLRQRQLRS